MSRTIIIQHNGIQEYNILQNNLEQNGILNNDIKEKKHTAEQQTNFESIPAKMPLHSIVTLRAMYVSKMSFYSLSFFLMLCLRMLL